MTESNKKKRLEFSSRLNVNEAEQLLEIKKQHPSLKTDREVLDLLLSNFENGLSKNEQELKTISAGLKINNQEIDLLRNLIAELVQLNSQQLEMESQQ